MRGSEPINGEIREDLLIVLSVRIAVLVCTVFVMLAADVSNATLVAVALAAYTLDTALRLIAAHIEERELCMRTREEDGILHSCTLASGHIGSHHYCCEDELRS